MENQDPIARFMEEHQHALRELNAMLLSSRELKQQGFTTAAYERLRAATHFINEDIRAHNRNEEKALFPLLEERIGPSGPTAVMRAEHQQLWQALEDLEKNLDHLVESPADTGITNRVSELSGFIHDFLQQHIFKEDNILYPMARELLTSEEMSQISFRILDQVNPLPPSV